MYRMYCYVWSYVVQPEHLDAFRQAYGPAGDWAKLFRRGPGYIRTTLLGECDDPTRFMTIDYWDSRQSCVSFRERYRKEIGALDQRFDLLTVEELHLGDYDVLDQTAPVLRLARLDDLPALKELIAISVRGLQNADYSKAQIDGALGTIYGTDRTMIGDGTFFVVEIGSTIVGCGGWSRRRTAFGSDDSPVKDDSPLDPKTEPAKIRGFFVHPDWARRGIASRVLVACEEAAEAAGFKRFELVSTLTGVALYRRYGYVEIERVTLTLPNSESYPAVRMQKGS